MSRLVIETKDDEHDAALKLARSLPGQPSASHMMRTLLRMALQGKVPSLASEVGTGRTTLQVSLAESEKPAEPETEYEIEMRKRAKAKARLDKFNAERRAKSKKG